ncbi:glycosyltransferase family 2 protein [Paenibacillus filicis]|uniref:Glycosyltransferase family 2 protein n=1 Tax=Paenibacillus gyeongsangnamensis TaxID=3388067 RepID=A0ABT4Q504_9BACL|nr:glycosyltransferase family 2 protein [Paenibacillus filicis]MCZ8511946.1 glycosyltransferase family 2 protein [Paenibacillus filicis]
MAVRYSVIIPTFNRAEQLLLTLVSFDRVNYLKDQYEIIVVDDGSTDGTRELVKGFRSGLRLHYFANEVQRGRSVTRNLGLRHAKGGYVVFCDADFIVLPEFFQVLDDDHRAYPRAVLSGIPNSWDDAYTHFHPDFSNVEKQKCREVLVQVGLWNDEFDTVDRIVPLLTPDDLINRTGRLSQLVIRDRFHPNVRIQFAKSDVAPWLMLITRCVSIPRTYLTRIGGFNEKFVKYGLEDWELGYRLHRMKIRFHSIRRVLGYHQEHPNVYRGEMGNKENLRIMYKTHGFMDPELNLFAVMPAWEDVANYKDTLRVLSRGMKSKSKRSTALLMKNTLRIAAEQFAKRKRPEAYKRSLRSIRMKLRALKKKGHTARVLRTILARSANLVNR